MQQQVQSKACRVIDPFGLFLEIFYLNEFFVLTKVQGQTDNLRT